MRREAEKRIENAPDGAMERRPAVFCPAVALAALAYL
jgi:hypothetical protein